MRPASVSCLTPWSCSATAAIGAWRSRRRREARTPHIGAIAVVSRKARTALPPPGDDEAAAARGASRNGGSDDEGLQRLLRGRHHDPHSLLGAHLETRDGESGVIVRAMHPDAELTELVLPDGEVHEMHRVLGGIFAAFLPGAEKPPRYRVRFRFANGRSEERRVGKECRSGWSSYH